LRVVRGGDRAAPSDADLVERARSGDRTAACALYDRHAPQVSRVLGRILGASPDVPDLLHDSFYAALEQLGELEEPSLFRPWVVRIAVFQARGYLRKRTRWRWLRVLSGEDPLEEPVHVSAPDEVTSALAAVYAILRSMPVEERIPFALRRIDGMALGEVAGACEVSLATIKRRIAAAEARFRAEAAQDPRLAEWIDEERGSTAP
jgi:RNA polymerase sigma-70 factor (ECF subfamily)